MVNIAPSRVHRIPRLWDLRKAVLFPSISAGNGRRCLDACLSSTFTYRDNLLDRVTTESKRKLRIYLDSGRECMGRTQSDSISIPFRKPATVLKIETIQDWNALSSYLSSGFQRRLRKYSRQLFGSEGSSLTRRKES